MKDSSIQNAGKILKDGGLVVFPTETVYGLGANAFLPKTIQKIYDVKGRAQDNPLIIHVAGVDEVSKIAQNIPESAYILAEKFWPGPLTLVLKKKDIIPDIVSAGGDTIGVRVPNHKIALDLIRSAGVPVVAPSANLSGKPSPTQYSHIVQDLEGKVDLILDGGKTDVGVESTVIDLTINPPLLLRPGGISHEQLSEVLGVVDIHPGLTQELSDDVLKSPGMRYRHYAPNAKLILAYNGKSEIQELIKKYKQSGKKIGVMATSENISEYSDADIVLDIGSINTLSDIARNLFKTLREFDTHGVDIILSETVPNDGIGMAIMDRLKRASEK